MKGGQKGRRRPVYRIPKAFDYPYLLTMGNGAVRYQLLPATVHGHRVNIVNYISEHVSYWSGNFICTRCKLLGGNDTMKQYRCLA